MVRTEIGWVLATVAATAFLVAGEARAQTEPEAAPVPEATPAAEAAPAPAPAAEPDHIAALQSVDVETRANAAQALASTRNPDAVPALTQSLRSDPSPVVRGWVVRALHEINTPPARSAIAAAARQDADERVRALALQLEPSAAPPPQVPAGAYGDPVPGEQQAPARRQRDPNRRLRVAGWVLFGSTYGFSILMGSIGMLADGEDAWPIFLPFAGMAIVGTRNAREDTWGADGIYAFAAVVGWLVSAIQTAGFIMAIVGHVRGRRADQDEGQARGPRIAVVPTAGNGGGGLSLAGLF